MNPLERTEINKANAEHSTGPKTEVGKQKSSLNALRHGLTSQIVVMPTEDLAAYQHHLANLADEYRPHGATEALLVQALADASWRLNRVAALESNILALATGNQSDPLTGALALAAALETHSKALANLSLHSQRLSRQFEKTITQLRSLQATRKAQENHDLDNLLDIMDMYEDKGETYTPDVEGKRDGFVFSAREIKAAQQARTRRNLALEAVDHANA